MGFHGKGRHRGSPWDLLAERILFSDTKTGLISCLWPCPISKKERSAGKFEISSNFQIKMKRILQMKV
jgi:hypothetical protein